MSKLKMCCSAGMEARERARSARATLLGSWPASSAGSSPAIASDAAPLLKAVAMAAYSHPAALSKLSCGACLKRRSFDASSLNNVVTSEAPALIGVLGDAPHQRQGFDRCAYDEFLPRSQAETDLHGNLRQTIQPLLLRQGMRHDVAGRRGCVHGRCLGHSAR